MADTLIEPAPLLRPSTFLGAWHRFGALGPAYEIVAIGEELPDSDRLMHIRVAETGEKLDYRLSAILEDPREA
jgi:hypothetical protein